MATPVKIGHWSTNFIISVFVFCTTCHIKSRKNMPEKFHGRIIMEFNFTSEHPKKNFVCPIALFLKPDEICWNIVPIQSCHPYCWSLEVNKATWWYYNSQAKVVPESWIVCYWTSPFTVYVHHWLHILISGAFQVPHTIKVQIYNRSKFRDCKAKDHEMIDTWL